MGEGEIKRVPAGNVQNLILFKKWAQFMNWFEACVENFPRKANGSWKPRIKNTMLEIAEKIIETNRRAEKTGGWFEVDTKFEIMRFFVRSARERKWLAPKSYERASLLLGELGKILGGLIAKAKASHGAKSF